MPKKSKDATVHPGSLGRRFEHLCRLEQSRLRDCVKRQSTRYVLPSESLPDRGGVYAFWWTGSTPTLRRRQRHLVLRGPGGRGVRLHFTDEWLGIEAGGPFPLYIGKTADSIRTRVRLHLLLGSFERVLQGGAQKAKAPTTSCQLRAGIERMFPKAKTPLELLLDNVGLSYVILDGDPHAANRFYLEDLAIGMMRPVLNVDIER
jgi:hypothetical protein